MKRFKSPLHCKTARLKALYKKKSKTDSQNYHFISRFRLVSEDIEKVIPNQTYNFLNKNKVLYKYQWGFRKPFSRSSCFSLLTNKVNEGFEFGK